MSKIGLVRLGMAWYGYEDYKDPLSVSLRLFLAELGKVIILDL
jgi:hypothetical protein